MRSEKKEERKGEDVFLRLGRAGHSHNKLRKKLWKITMYRKIFPKKREICFPAE